MKALLSTALIFSVLLAGAQKLPAKKYPSLLWEITGNGMKKPSYLFGTMHVSSKLAFHLSDSFYNAIKRVDKVALETNPGTWQEDFQTSLFSSPNSIYGAGADMSKTNDYIKKSTFQFDPYEDQLRIALALEPEVLNSFLYRSSGPAADFEEDTYLDMHIFQTGSRLGKAVLGVENFRLSEEYIIEGYKAEAQEVKKKKNRRNDDDENSSSIYERIQDAYRNGDLDMLDSLENLTAQSDAFNEWFLLKRNDMQADGMDSVMRTGSSLFTGVGAAHLAGKRGVIETLRKKGYKLRPIFMGLQSSKQKDAIEKIKIPKVFSTQTTKDGFIKVDMPGKLYSFPFMSRIGNQQLIHADFSNGAYYTINRVQTHGAFWGHDADYLFRKIDSLLYENIPGKILNKTVINRNGYKGFDITNKTRRGDVQRYHIFCTPLELIVFKMSGRNNYVNGEEAKKFFGSISFVDNTPKTWTKFSPEQGGFEVQMPTVPLPDMGATKSNLLMEMYSGRNGGKSPKMFGYEAYDKANGNVYYLMSKTILNYNYLANDSFVVALGAESLLSSNFMQEPESRRYFANKGYPCLELKGRMKDSVRYKVWVQLKGNTQYLLLARIKQDEMAANKFFESFRITPFVQSPYKQYVDTLLNFSVKTNIYPDSLSEVYAAISRMAERTRKQIEKEEGTNRRDESEDYWEDEKNTVFLNDTTGEEISVTQIKYPKYFYPDDTTAFFKRRVRYMNTNDSDFVLIKKQILYPGKGIREINLVFGDTGSSARIMHKFLIQKGVAYHLSALYDTIAGPSEFIANFFQTFKVHKDSALGNDIFANKSKLFFADLLSKDSALNKKARKSITQIDFVDEDFGEVKNALAQLKRSDKEYLITKAKLIEAIGGMSKTPGVVAYLKEAYNKAGDTTTLQNAAVNALAKHKTQEAYDLLKQILVNDPPIFESNYSEDNLFDHLRDSIALTKTMLPDILPLTSLDDYKWKIYRLLERGLDSNVVQAKDYESIYAKLYFDAKRELKKLAASDEKKAAKTTIESAPTEAVAVAAAAAAAVVEVAANQLDEDDDDDDRRSNDNDLDIYSPLLYPFWDKYPAVPAYFDKLMNSRDEAVRLQTAMLFVKNKRPVADSVFVRLGKEEKKRKKLYQELEDVERLDLFPKQYRNQEQMAKAMLTIKNTSYNKKDSITSLNIKMPVSYKGNNGYVYFFKYKEGKKDEDWMIATSGPQPMDTTKVNIEDDMVEFTGKLIKKDKPLKEQLEKILKEALYEKNKVSSRFYDRYRDRYDYNRTYRSRR